jgi:dipeptidyl aminopeptidase/acylaminoacyl peptidase
MRCPFCGAANRADVTFCYACGESLDPEIAPAVPAPPPPAPPRWRRLPWEVLLGVSILLIIAGVTVVTGWQETIRTEQARYYRAGQQALTAGHLDEALPAFQRAGSYRDAAGLSAHLAPQVAQLEAGYRAGVAAAQAGAWWDAAHALSAAANIQISYRDVVTRLQEARDHAGPIFYRMADNNGEVALWWANADGTAPRRLPFSTPTSELLAVSPDHHWAIYSHGPAAQAGADPQGPFLLDLRQVSVTSLAQRYRDLEGAVRVRFRDDSQGFWWGYDNQAFYYDLRNQTGLPLSEMPAAIDPGHATLLLNRTLAGDGAVRARLLLSDPLGRQRIPLVEEPGEIRDARFSDDGRYLLYTVNALPVKDTTGRDVVTATLVLQDLDAGDAPVRTELAHVQAVVDGQPVGWLRMDFIPNTSTVVILRGEGDHWTLSARSANGTVDKLAEGAAVGRQDPDLLAVLAVPNSSELAVSLTTANGRRTDLTLLRLDGGRTVIAPGTLSGRWMGFSPDGHTALISQRDPKAATVARQVRLAVLDHSAAPAPLPFALSVAGPSQGTDPAFTGDGQRLFVIGSFDGHPGLYAVRPDGSDPQLVIAGATAFWTGQVMAHPLLVDHTKSMFLDP